MLKEKQISSSQIEDRSCRTGEPVAGSPARHLQLNEGHLAGILDDMQMLFSVILENR